MDFSWRSFAFGFRLLLVFICVELLHYLFMICVLHELGLWFVVGFEHLVYNVWWIILVCDTLIYLCSSCGCEVVLTKLKFISYIYLVSCMPRFPLVGKTPSKVSNIYMCTWYSWKLICTYQGGVLSTHRTWWIYSYHILKFSRKWVSSSKVQFQVHLMPSV